MNTQPAGQRSVDTQHLHALELLLPVDATERSRWVIGYALALKRSGVDVAASLLHVVEPVRAWQVLRFWTEERVRQFQTERGEHLLQESAQILTQAGIPVESNCREGDVVFEILDFAEQCRCDEIVLPVPNPRWAKLASTDVVRHVIRRRRSTPITTVNSRGAAEPA